MPQFEFDSVLKHNRRWVLCFLEKVLPSALFHPVLTAKEYVGLFCVATKVCKQRLIVDARSANARMRAPPATPLATSDSLSQFISVILHEGCDLHGPEAQRIYTYSSVTVASCDVENCLEVITGHCNVLLWRPSTVSSVSSVRVSTLA